MSDRGDMILCRECNERIPTEVEKCPHCGRSKQGNGPYLAVAVGAIIFVSAIVGTLWSFALVGLFITGAGGWLLWDKRQRIHRAHQQIE